MSQRPSQSSQPKPITTDDLQAKFAELKGSTDESVEQAQSMIAIVGAAALGAVVIAAFLIGRRRGRKKQTVVEIRRI